MIWGGYGVIGVGSNGIFLIRNLVINENSFTESGSTGIIYRRCGNFVFVDEIEVKRKEKQVERKEVRDFTDTSFHKYWIYRFF